MSLTAYLVHPARPHPCCSNRLSRDTNLHYRHHIVKQKIPVHGTYLRLSSSYFWCPLSEYFWVGMSPLLSQLYPHTQWSETRQMTNKNPMGQVWSHLSVYLCNICSCNIYEYNMVVSQDRFSADLIRPNYRTPVQTSSPSAETLENTPVSQLGSSPGIDLITIGKVDAFLLLYQAIAALKLHYSNL